LFLRQRLAVAVQRGNASCIIGTLKIDHHVKWQYVIAVIDLNIAKWHYSSLYDVHNNNNNKNNINYDNLYHATTQNNRYKVYFMLPTGVQLAIHLEYCEDTPVYVSSARLRSPFNDRNIDRF